MKVEDIMCETLLNSYMDLEALCDKVDERMLRYGLYSANFHTDIFNVFDKMTGLINEKIAYCNIKVLIEEACAEITSSTELQHKYLLGYKNEDIIKKFGLNIRTFFRKMQRQKEKVFFVMKNRQSKKQLFDLISSSTALTKRFDLLIEQELEKEKEFDNVI